MSYTVNPDFILKEEERTLFDTSYLGRPVGVAFGISLEEMQMFVLDPEHKDMEFRLELIPETNLMWVWVNGEELKKAKMATASEDNKKSMNSFVEKLPFVTPMLLVISTMVSFFVAIGIVTTGWFFPWLGAIGFWPAFGIMMGLCVVAILVIYAWAFLNHGKVD